MTKFGKSPLTLFTGKRLLNTVLFPPGTKYGTKKTANYRRDDDFELSLRYQQIIGS